MGDNVMDFIVLDVLDEDDVLGPLALQFINGNNREGVARRDIIRVDINSWRRLGDPTFREHFRMTRTVFEKLILAVGLHLEGRGRIVFIRTPLDVALMMAVWILASPDSFRSTGVTFGVSRSVVFYHYTYIIEALREMAPIYVTWPGPVERAIIKVYNEEHYGYPGAVGFIDCTHIRVLGPTVQPQRYVNRHHDYSIMIQAVCDHRLLYRDVYVGEPGAVGDVRALARSPLSRNLYGGQGFMFEDEHLLADGIYIQTDKMLTPYTHNGHLNRRQRTHNYIHSRSRSAVERSFARLRCLFRRLKLLPSVRLEYAIDHIMASIVLHNFVILDGEESGLPGDERPVPCAQGVVIEEHVMNEARDLGTYKREYIATLLHPADE